MVLLLVVLFVVLAVSMVGLYLLPAALTNLAYHDSLRRGFALTEVVGGAVSVQYFVGAVAAVAVSTAGAIVIQLLWLLVIGVFVGWVLYFWVLVASAYLLGRGYCQARGLGAAAALDVESTDDGSGAGTRYQ